MGTVTPTTTKAFIEAWHNVNVEKSSQRIFEDSEFKHVGVKLEPEESWVNAPHNHIIVGVKELMEDKCARNHPVRGLIDSSKLLSSTPTFNLRTLQGPKWLARRPGPFS